MNPGKKPLVIIAGPTAVGKSAFAVALARRINGSVISADSMQVYRGMDIGSAKITLAEMQGIPHYLIDVLEPDEEFHVAKFQALAKEALDTIVSQGRIPILCGGTGFYIQALLYDISFTEQEDNPQLRNDLTAFYEAHGAEALHQKLEGVDPDAAAAIPFQNVKRVMRALEFYAQSGQRISEHNASERQKPPAYHARYFVLTEPRDRLYEKINERVDAMMEQGLLAEVQALKERGFTRTDVAMQGLGYKELFAFLEGDCTLETAVYTIKRDSRHFAKRQLTWFKREHDVTWLAKEDYDYDNNRILEQMINYLKQDKII